LVEAPGGGVLDDALVGVGLGVVVDVGAGAAGDQLHEGCALLEREDVGADVNDAEGAGDAEVVCEARVAFAGDADDQVDAAVAAARGG
jgi:hypothetical protein